MGKVISGYKTGLLLHLGAGAMILVLLFQVAGRYRFRWDMTEEKRYGISPPVKDLLGRLNQNVLVEVYLAGEMPSSFIRFQKAIRETLEEFSVHGGADIDVKYVNPAQAKSTKARNQFFRGLIDKGLRPTNLNFTKDGQNTRKMIFPGAVVSIGGRELPVNLLKGSRVASPEEIINQSIENLEYEFAATIKQLTDPGRKKIGLIAGHGEPDSTHLDGLTKAISAKYDLFKLDLPRRALPIVGYDLLLIVKPAEPFTDNEKFLLDQYVMKGGRLALFLDALHINLDSALSSSSVATPVQFNLEDLLFKYGARVNQNYVADLNAGSLPVVTGNMGNQPQVTLLDWPYFPVVTNYGKHPVVRNMDAVMLKMASTIDTVKAVGIKKTPLMSSSANTKVIGYPVEVSLNDLRGALLPELFRSGPQAMGYLLEGNFTSLYKNRFSPKAFRDVDKIDEGEPSKIIVVSDGNLITNEISPENGKPLPWGTAFFSQTNYANEVLVMNMIDYLVDEDGLIEARSKEVKIRPLDKVKIKGGKIKWQVVNLVLPILAVLTFGLIKMAWRNRKNKF